MASSGEVIGIAKLPQYFDAIAFSQTGSLALGTSHLTGRTWRGALAIFCEPEYAPNLPHISHGTTLDGGCTDVAWITERKIAVSTDAGSVEVWDLKGDCQLENALTLAEHGDVCSSVSVAPSGCQIVSGGWDSVIKVWDLAMDISIHTIRIHADKVLDVCFDDNSSDVFASASEDGSIKIYDNRDSKPASLLNYAASIFPCCLAWNSSVSIFSGCSDGSICVFDVRVPGQPDCTKQIHKKAVNDLILYSAEPDVVVSCSNDLAIKASDISTLDEVLISSRHTDYVRGLAINPVSKVVWSCAWDGQVLPHDVAMRKVEVMES